MLAGCCTKRVTCSHQHAAPCRDLLRGDFSDAGGLAGTIHADDEPDVGCAAREIEGQSAIRSRQSCDHFASQGRNEPSCVGNLTTLHTLAQRIEQRCGDLHTEVGSQHGFFELVPRCLIDGAATQHARGGGGEHAACASEAIAKRRRGCRRDWRSGGWRDWGRRCDGRRRRNTRASRAKREDCGTANQHRRNRGDENPGVVHADCAATRSTTTRDEPPGCIVTPSRLSPASIVRFW